jgi:hypothetical protein
MIGSRMAPSGTFHGPGSPKGAVANESLAEVRTALLLAKKH